MRCSVVHIYIYGLLKREVDGGSIIHISKINPIIKSVVRIPHKYKKDIIHELVERNLLRKIDRDNYEIVTCRMKHLSDSLGSPLW